MKLQSTEAMMDDEVLDWESLSDRCLGRMDLVEKVLARFQSSLDDSLQQLEEALTGNDLTGIAQIAHRIKGMSLTVSATGLANRALHLEANARSGDPAIHHYLSEMRDEAGRISVRIDDRRAGGV